MWHDADEITINNVLPIGTDDVRFGRNRPWYKLYASAKVGKNTT